MGTLAKAVGCAKGDNIKVEPKGVCVSPFAKNGQELGCKPPQSQRAEAQGGFVAAMVAAVPDAVNGGNGSRDGAWVRPGAPGG